jgi:DNA-binding transcriptional MocR family regulator
LSDKALDGALDDVRKSYHRRRETIANILRTNLAAMGTIITGTDGLNLWVQLPFGIAATDVVDRSAEAGVLLISGEPFYIRPGHNNAVRMSISGISDSQAELAARRVVEAIRTSSGAASFTIPI